MHGLSWALVAAGSNKRYTNANLSAGSRPEDLRTVLALARMGCLLVYTKFRF